MNSEQHPSSEYLVAALCEKWGNLGAITGMKRARLRTHSAAEISHHTASAAFFKNTSYFFAIPRKIPEPPYLK